MQGAVVVPHQLGGAERDQVVPGLHGVRQDDGTGKGTFKARVKLFGNWGGSYNAIVGVGDITGDGKADIVSRDTSGAVWRNNGNGKGSFGGRTKIATGWQGYKGLF
ncbi:FG-GAP repeat domain-containing protein [Streptomyces sp. NPDC059340]|uniref:FG-GAP repeat domain-containing protein n=1 Tax=Streptomyces sp. NPDC059340 TaxID=3346806 RepID=UPI0036A0DEF4